MVDGIVLRDANGREIRKVIEPTKVERKIATIICEIFGQIVCGFDVLRVNRNPYVADVNSWSLVRSNSDYHYKCANALRDYFFSFIRRTNIPDLRQSRAKGQYTMMGYFSVIGCVEENNNEVQKVREGSL